MNKCLICGCDIESGEHCQPCVDKGLVAVKSIVADGVKGVGDQVKSIDEKITSIEEGQKSVDERISALENAPIARAFNINTRSSTHLGYKLSKQNIALREKASKNPLRYQAFSDDEQAEDYAKFMINITRALSGDVKAQMELQAKASDLVAGTDNLGGYTVPVQFQADLIELAKEESFALRECDSINMTTDNLKIPSEATRVTTAWIDENNAITASNPTFGQVDLTAKKLAGLTAGVSSELLADTAIDIVGRITQQFMYATGIELDNQVLNGTGSPVSGILTASAGNSVVMLTDAFSTVSFDDLSDMIAELSEADLRNAKFIYNKSIQNFLRKTKTTTNDYVYQKPQGGQPATIWEVPVIRASNAPSTTGASTAFVALGDLKKFIVARRATAMTIDVDPYTAFAEDTKRFRMITRWGLGIARASAFVRLLTSA